MSHTIENRPLPLAAVFSVAGETLTLAEKSLFSAAQPFGFILFGRNCKNPEQLKNLTQQLRKAVGWNCPIMIDQEGGRVARLKPPEWPSFGAAKRYGDKILAGEGQDDLTRDMGAMARMLKEMGVDTNCAPVGDVLTQNTHQVIGDRAYSSDPAIVLAGMAATCRAFLEEGVTPIIKHLPGHGRAEVDSHHDLPLVTASIEEMRSTDFAPFHDVMKFDFAPAVWGMVAHVIYEQIDPNLPSSLSPIVINNVIRKDIGFDGLLFSDDLDMKALDKYGSIPQRAEQSLQAGCDIALYCWAKMDVMEHLAATLPPLSAKGWKRWENSMSFHINSDKKIIPPL